MVAIYKGLTEIHTTKKTRIICTDSLSALLSLKDIFSTNPIIQNILFSLQTTSQTTISTYFVWVPSHCGIIGNELADRAAKQATEDGIPYQGVPVEDFISVIKQTMKTRWEHTWWNTRDNKLREIKNDISLWKSSLRDKRREEVILTRLRIGHTRLTHGYLMTRDPPTDCQTCGSALTVKHVLTECRTYDLLRQRFSIATDLPTVLQDDIQTIEKLFDFLKHTGLYNKI